MIKLNTLIRKVPNFYLLFLLILIAGVAEGIGLSALMPVVSSLTNKDNPLVLPPPFNFLQKIFEYFSISPSFALMLTATFVIMLASFAMLLIQDRAIAKARSTLLRSMREQAGQLIFKTQWERWFNFVSGDISSVVIHETEKGSEALIALINLIAMSVQLFIYGFFAFLLSWKMCLVALIVISLAAILAIRLIRQVRKFGKLNTDSNTFYSRYFVEFVRGAKLIKATGLETFAINKLQHSNSQAANALGSIMFNSAKMRFELQAIISLSMVIILYLAVSVFKLETATILVFMFIVMRLAPKFVTFQGQYHSFTAQLPALELFEKVISESRNFQEEKSGKLEFTRMKSQMLLTDVCYRYPSSAENVLNKISLSILPKEFVALVGKSGSGKSTTLDVIMGLLVPQSGSITIDGQNLNQYFRESLQKKIGFVSQESIFFTGTVKENLQLNQNFPENKIWKALEIAQLKNFIETLPNGLNAQIGEAGLMLSGGQKQRLAIARALLREPEFLILDEATSALDGESEVAFQKAIDSVSHQYTMIVVAHRLSTIKKANKIYVFDHGKIVQEGNYQELSAKEGIFQNLKQHQFLDDH